MAFCGASADDELVLELATQPVWLSAVSAAEAALTKNGATMRRPATVIAAMKTRAARRATPGGDAWMGTEPSWC
jgi:hypothetical protein